MVQDDYYTTGVNFSHSTQLTAAGISDALQLTPASTGTVDGTTYVQFDGVTSFSGGGAAYTVGVNSVILPIELLSFNAVKYDEYVKLLWSTATETNNDYFTIEKTVDGKTFEVVGIVPGAGNSNNRLDYSLIDPSPYSGISYYRLTQTDYDNTQSFSELRKVEYGAEGSFSVMAFPNPAKDEVTIQVNGALQNFKLALHDMDGKVVHTSQLIEGRAVIDLSKLQEGVYMLQLSDESQIHSVRIVKLR